MRRKVVFFQFIKLIVFYFSGGKIDWFSTAVAHVFFSVLVMSEKSFVVCSQTWLILNFFGLWFLIVYSLHLEARGATSTLTSMCPRSFSLFFQIDGLFHFGQDLLLSFLWYFIKDGRRVIPHCCVYATVKASGLMYQLCIE